MSETPVNDPITMDPGVVDWDWPPTMAGLTFASHGHNLNGPMYMTSDRWRP